MTKINPHAKLQYYMSVPSACEAHYFDKDFHYFIDPKDLELTISVGVFDKIKQGNPCVFVTLKNRDGKTLDFTLRYTGYRAFEIENVQRTFTDKNPEFVDLNEIPEWCRTMVLQHGHFEIFKSDEYADILY